MGNSVKALADLERHHIGWFPATLLQRRETIEETLDSFEPDDKFDLNRIIAVRTHSLYEPSPEALEQLRQALVKNSDFAHVEILQEPSSLGIASKILAKDRAGQTIIYDGGIWQVTEPVCKEHFALEEIDQLVVWPGYPGDIVSSLQHSLREVLSLREGSSFYSFYTVSTVDWEALGLRKEGEAKLRLGFEGFRSYSVYIGDRESTLQMIASDLHIGMELKRFQEYFDKQRATLSRVGLWDFAWWVYQEVNFSPRITQIALIFFIFFSREFALFAVNFNSTMRNPKEPSSFQHSVRCHNRSSDSGTHRETLCVLTKLPQHSITGDPAAGRYLQESAQDGTGDDTGQHRHHA